MVVKLTRTYVTLSLADIATEAGLSGAEEAESLLLRMIHAGEISARIDRVQAMVHFSVAGESLGHGAMKQQLENRLEQLSGFAQKLRAMHDELVGDTVFIHKSMERGSRLGSSGQAVPSHAALDDLSVA